MMDVENSNWTPKAKKAWEDALEMAEAHNHSLLNNCHLLYSFWSNSNVSFKLFIKSRGVQLDEERIYNIFEKYCAQNKSLFTSKEPSFSPLIKKSIKEAFKIAEKKGNSFVGTEHVIYGILQSDKHLNNFLFTKDVDTEHLKLCIETFIAGGVQIDGLEEFREDIEFDDDDDDDDDEDMSHDVISKYCSLLNEEVVKPSFPKISGREKEISLMEEVLCRKIKSNCVLVGEAGTGKTTIVEGLAQLLESPEYEGPLYKKKIYSLDLSLLIGGTKYRGQLEQRFSRLLDAFKEDQDKIMFIDELHTIIGAGSKEGSQDLANMLKPALARGEIKCIGATTSAEYKKYFENDAALSRRFHCINVSEPSKDEVVAMITGALGSYEEHHNVRFPVALAETAVEMCATYLPHQRFPDKAFDVIDQAAAKARIRSPLRKIKVSEMDVCSVIADKINVDVKTIKQKYHESFSCFEKNLSEVIFGQENNINKIYDTLACSRIGLRDNTKPLASFFFVGPTSVGKTYTAKQIAKEFYGNEKSSLQLNMSEYQDQTSISKLIGANAGYVGYEEGGILTEFVRKNPNSLILFDEAEKCNRGVLNLLLQILDEAKLSDNLNRSVDFSRCIVVMTSNIGVKESDTKQMGFIIDETPKNVVYEDSVKKYLPPELVARIDEIIVFNELKSESIINIFKSQLNALKETLKSKNIELKVHNSITDLITKKSDIHARKTKQIMRQEIEVPLAKFILKNPQIEKITLKVLDGKVNIC